MEISFESSYLFSIKDILFENGYKIEMEDIFKGFSKYVDIYHVSVVPDPNDISMSFVSIYADLSLITNKFGKILISEGKSTYKELKYIVEIDEEPINLLEGSCFDDGETIESDFSISIIDMIDEEVNLFLKLDILNFIEKVISKHQVQWTCEFKEYYKQKQMIFKQY